MFIHISHTHAHVCVRTLTHTNVQRVTYDETLDGKKVPSKEKTLPTYLLSLFFTRF